MLMHIDGNSFYASCERLFRPDLAKSAIAVLTNNDGIIIALNDECKALGFKRGDVYYKVRGQLAAAGVTVFSSNYTLYADISARLNVIYNRFAVDVEMYSIDESFLFFPDWKNADYSEIGQEIRTAVKQEIGVPVSVGIASSKTLAKLCNKLAKKHGGVCDWSKLDQDAELAACPVRDIWGIGHNKANSLRARNIITALDLKHYPLEKAKKNLSIVGMRTVQELNGICAIDKTEGRAHQNIIVSRSFGTAVSTIDEIITALSQFTQEAVKRLRADKLACNSVVVYLVTNPGKGGDYYGNSATAKLKQPTSFLPDITRAANDLLRRLYREGFKYRKVLVSLFDLVPDKDIQADLFDDGTAKERKETVMLAFDKINDRYGRGMIHVGCGDLVKRHTEDGAAPWVMKREMLSPNYTTSLTDLPRVS